MKNFFIKHKFNWWLIGITLIGGVIRYSNINYASLWGDELYSLFSVHPSNSWYEVLYWQRAYQPPLYFMVLWLWLKIFAYNEFYARLLSVLVGTLGIWASGYLGRKVKNEWVGIAMALLVAFSPAQIWYSLEARFYGFVYLFAVLSLLIYWHILQTSPKGFLVYFIKAVVDASLSYFHHFGIVFVFAQFCFDCILFIKNRDKKVFFRKTGGYILSALFYAPWAYWGLSEGLSIKQYWFKDISIIKYFLFSIDYPLIIQVIAILLIAIFLIVYLRKKEAFNYIVFPLVCVISILIPYIYSVVKLPILVDRYSMVMAPAIYLMIVLGLNALFQKVNRKQMLYPMLLITALTIFSAEGIYMSYINKDKLKKHPWREVATWIKEQPDYSKAAVYGPPASFKNFMLIDFYLNRPTPSLSIYDLKPGNDEKMYLVEGSGIWKIKEDLLEKVALQYTVTKIGFQQDNPSSGAVYVCVKKLP